MKIVLNGQVFAQDPPDDYADIFGRRVQVPKFCRVEVQVFMIKAVFHFPVDKPGQPAEIDDHTGLGINFTGHFHLQFVVVAVPVGVVAEAENLPVLFIRPGGVVQAVGGIKMGTAYYGNFHVYRLYMIDWAHPVAANRCAGAPEASKLR